ncbi:Galactose/methyl galactoside ABC transport system, ATP-binding protein MglA [Clostridiaceae bacterium JG1575]|nr:Galactose/methyl galactoside ABC transport system, ATP-binding protein MglA [Clostridiaceae bacterium JG1575]
MAENYILEMLGVEKTFPGVRALDGVNLRIRPGTVHALMGENGAGKSTLMKCLFGIYKMDQGSIRFDGKDVTIKNSLDALNQGISMVHQELNQVRSTRILDNIWLGRFPKKGLFVDEQKMLKDTQEIFSNLGISLDPRQKTKTLPVSQAQMVEIAKAVSYHSKLIVMDEPTSSLTQREVDQLFRIIRELKKQNVAIIYISHKMDEIREISDEVTIMRDGHWICTQPIEKLSTNDIVRLMVGRSLDNRFPEVAYERGEKILEVEHLTAVAPDSIKDVTFDLYRGEILGVAGLVGSKRTDLLECLFGDRRIASGTLKKDGTIITNKNPRQAKGHGFAMVTEERRATGIFGEMSVGFNSVIANIRKYKKGPFVFDGPMDEDTKRVITSMKVKTPSKNTKIRSLSGGNQQKVIIGRWLLTDPDILLMDEPTRGIDVGAKYEIYQIMQEMAREGKSVVMVSSEMPEILGVSDRILVMSNGRLAGILNKKDATQEQIMELSAKYL